MNAASEYLEARVLTASPQELHLMVVDGAIRHATGAQQALESSDFETSHFALNRSREFVMELISGLAEDKATEIVTQLKQLFGFAYRQLNEADLQHDPQKVGDALRVLELHRDTWRELIELQKSDGPPTE